MTAALARKEREQDQAPRATLWLVIPGRAPIPLASQPFHPETLTRPPGQTERLLREARETAARKASRAAGAGGRQRGEDSDLQSVFETQRALNDGRGPVHWYEPAHSLGMTQVQAAQQYGKPAGMVRQVYREQGDQRATLGRRDAWDCWFVDDRQALDRVFSPPKADACAPSAAQRAAAVADELRRQKRERTR